MSRKTGTDADKNLITTLSYLLLPMIFFYGMSALFAGVLNTRGHFAMPTFTPILGMAAKSARRRLKKDRRSCCRTGASAAAFLRLPQR